MTKVFFWKWFPIKIEAELPSGGTIFVKQLPSFSLENKRPSKILEGEHQSLHL